MKSRKGFTLIELMVVVGIMGVLLGAAALSYTTYLPRQRLLGTTREIMTDMQFLRAKAVKLNTTCVVVFNPGAFLPEGGVGSYFAFIDDDDSWTQDDVLINATGASGPDDLVDPGEATVLPITNKTMPPGVSMISASFTSNGLSGAQRFDANQDGAYDLTKADAATTMTAFNSHGITARSPSGAFVFGELVLRNNIEEWVKIIVTPTGQVVMKTSDDGIVWN